MSHSARAVGFRVLVKPDPVEETSKGGIVIISDKRLEANATITGVVLDVGPEAYRAFNKSAGVEYSPWVKPGDHIYYAKYAGKWIEDKATKEALLYLNDEDVVGLVE